MKETSTSKCKVNWINKRGRKIERNKRNKLHAIIKTEYDREIGCYLLQAIMQAGRQACERVSKECNHKQAILELRV